MSAFHIQPQVFKSNHPLVYVSVFHENDLGRVAISSFLDSAVDSVIGIAPSYGTKCVLNTIALASASHVLLIRLASLAASRKVRKGKQNKAIVSRSFLADVLCHVDITKCVFEMDKFSTALHLDLNLRITNGVDLLSVAREDRHSLEAVMTAMGGEATLNKPKVSALFKDDKSGGDLHAIAMRAWVAGHAGRLRHMSSRLAVLARINTQVMDVEHLAVLSKTVRDADRLIALKPTKVKNEVDGKFSYQKGKVELHSSRFRTRVMRTAGNQTIEIGTDAGGGTFKAVGRTAIVNGRAATISLQTSFQGKQIRFVTTIGREARTRAEVMRGDVVMNALQRTSDIMESPFVRRIWLPNEVASWAGTPSPPLPVPLYFPAPRTLNPSQKKAVNMILSNRQADRIVLIHGPPGTGKTTVIAAVVTSVMDSGNLSSTLWIIAQSNVAVKNVAEKLADVNFFDFKLLVSKDFHFDWHEHLYGKIVNNVIRSDDFTESLVLTERLLLGSRVILCTLSMLSHQKLSHFIQLVPPQILLFDEASQIEIGDYFPLLRRFRPTLSKLVFIGDDKQLAPYGQGEIDNLRSIFEMPHLRTNAVLLDTQYRMPLPIGQFISRHVYNGRVKTVHSISSTKCCVFVDVATGKEQQKGNSWKNEREIQVAMRVATKYHNLGKSYRIITPYDAQRSRLENALIAEKLPWEDRCFNVDSFQGNEEDFIILSLVRSEKIGFLKEDRRVNVMLTRCKRGLIILTSRAFVEGKASSSLVGALAKELGPRAWIDSKKVLFGNFTPFF